ncbi:MAG: 3-deoxy-D-manno-octulosonic acid transferase [Chitinophagaceae bacterium]
MWIHCASAGELEQGKPVIEALKNNFPSHKILLSLFSPSGYAVAIKYQLADIVTYLPADTRSNAKRIFDIIKPELVIFVKYEYWFHHLSVVAFHHVPLLLVSAIFRKEQIFFRGYGKFFIQILFLFRKIFVQDQSSLELLNAHQVNHAVVIGDTRFDRVKKIAGNFTPLPVIDVFINHKKAIVAGSTWPEDERLLAAFVNSQDIKLIIAPHEINEGHIQNIEKLFPGSIRYSRIENADNNSNVLIVDNFGLLSKLYYYGIITYIGGGFNKSGIHNTLEAAVYGTPVFFGPNYQKFKEARDLINCRGAFSISNEEELKSKMNLLLNDAKHLEISSKASAKYVEENTGATEKIIQFIQANRLLTR